MLKKKKDKRYELFCFDTRKKKKRNMKERRVKKDIKENVKRGNKDIQ